MTVIIVIVVVIVALGVIGYFANVAEAAANAAARGSFIDPRDGKTYKTIKIGSQTWMAENLKYEAESSKSINSEKYGLLYNWDTAMKACPEGWHLPSDAEWNKLINFSGGKEVAGKKLKAISGWSDQYYKSGEWAGSGNGTDNYGFSARPGGYCYSDGKPFDLVDKIGVWWSSSGDTCH
ncbi:MAG: hypothetical protein LBH25_10090 [Fibromonadaceae bacterium]|jgi:uncharacterized protein (TIGR02145 family)|nr:hypothetical protein [Fibromonadaceae bacterium]